MCRKFLTWTENNDNILLMVEALNRAIDEAATFKEIEPKERKFKVIQGGMGAGVSDWRLARAVAIAGEKLGKRVLGVVSGTGLPQIMFNRLQDGDSNTKRALEAFDKELGLNIGEELIQKYYVSEKSELQEKPRKLVLPKPEVLVTGKERKRTEMIDLAVASAFVEVWLAKQEHHQPIGINVLEKIQLMHLPTLLGAMLAGVDYVLIGAGIPTQIPQLLKDFANRNTASYKLDVKGLPEGFMMTLDPKQRFMSGKKELTKPKFFPIVSHDVLVKYLANKVEVDGFVIEGPLAGGHNAPPRGKEKTFNTVGEPIYGEKDIPDLATILAITKELGKPFYLAGGYATPDKLAEAQRNGATGIQVGSIFALCNESGIREDLKQQLRDGITAGTLSVLTSAKVSPSGFPFQVAQLANTISNHEVFIKRTPLCDLGYLVEAFKTPEGAAGTGVGFRCPSEPENNYKRKGGKKEERDGRVCLCNALIDTVNPQGKFPIVTLGKELDPIKALMEGKEGGRYSAEDVVRYLTSHK